MLKFYISEMTTFEFFVGKPMLIWQSFNLKLIQPKSLSPPSEVPIWGRGILGKLSTEVPKSSMRSSNSGGILGTLLPKVLPMRNSISKGEGHSLPRIEYSV